MDVKLDGILPMLMNSPDSMMAASSMFEEEREEFYSCPNCKTGKVFRWDGHWQCNVCDWMPPLSKEQVE